MPATRPLVLLPPSKGKALGGDGPAYAAQLTGDHALVGARRAVLEAVRTDLPGLDDRAVARLAGVGAGKVAGARHLLDDLATAPTMPAHRRYTGIVHGNAGLADVDPGRVRADVVIVSALLGLVTLAEPVPDYRIEFGATLPSLGGLGPFWRRALADHLAELGSGRCVWDLLPGEHRRVWDPAVRDGLDVVEVVFVRPDGRPANAARAKVAKGRFAAELLARPRLRPRDATTIELGEGWKVTAGSDRVTATYTG